MMRTPQTLIGAIRNGLVTAQLAGLTVEELVLLRQHVRDFLAQKFAAVLLELDGNQVATQVAKDLWHRITGEYL